MENLLAAEMQLQDKQQEQLKQLQKQMLQQQQLIKLQSKKSKHLVS